MNFKRVFKQVDFWLQFLHISVSALALWLIPDNTLIMGNYVMTVHIAVFGVFSLAFLQIFSTILNFLIYKKERNSQRKFYEKLTPAFVVSLVSITVISNFPLSIQKIANFDMLNFLIALFGLLFYLSIFSNVVFEYYF